MAEKGRFQSQRSRTILGLVVVAISLAVTAVLAGIGFARSSISAGQYQYGKVTICHHTHSKTNPTVTITISRNALPAHLAHGDTIGPCPKASSGKGKGKGKDNGKGQGNSGTPSQGQTTNPGQDQGNNGQGGDHGKPSDPPGNGGGGNGHGKGHGK